MRGGAAECNRARPEVLRLLTGPAAQRGQLPAEPFGLRLGLAPGAGFLLGPGLGLPLGGARLLDLLARGRQPALPLRVVQPQLLAAPLQVQPEHPAGQPTF